MIRVGVGVLLAFLLIAVPAMASPADVQRATSLYTQGAAQYDARQFASPNTELRADVENRILGLEEAQRILDIDRPSPASRNRAQRPTPEIALFGTWATPTIVVAVGGNGTIIVGK